jgi:alkaline phosphatase
MVRINTASMEYSGKLSDEPTDSAASATAMATGHLTVNKYLGMLPDGTELQTILDVAGTMGKATGIVTTDSLLGATPSGFSAHSRSRAADSVVMSTQLDSGVNLLCGNRDSVCTALKPQIEEKGYAYSDDFLNLNFDSDKAYWQLSMGGTDALNPLQDIAIEALNYLNQDPDGFVLMIEQAHIDKYSHNHEFLDTCKSVSDLNSTVEAVMNWLGDRTDTAVLITADHETGGLVVSNEAGKYANPIEGPNGTLYYEYRNGGHTSANVALYVHGVTVDFTKSELYKDEVFKNTGIYYLMSDILNIEANQG